MKIILSRKGFDSTYGKMPSPILPDGTLLSFPIPEKESDNYYSKLFYKEKSYSQIINELGAKITEDNCHLDPDIRREVKMRDKNWKALFGQSDQAQSHLQNEGVQKDDLFLFFGWFKQAELSNTGKLKYKWGAPDIHLLWGYLQVGEMYTNVNVPDALRFHPHSKGHYLNKKFNCIYEATDILTFNNDYKGYGCFKYHDNLVLTKKGCTRSQWELPDYFKNVKITYHSQESFKHGFFDSAKIGQEFVIEATKDIKNWADNVIQSGMTA